MLTIDKAGIVRHPKVRLEHNLTPIGKPVVNSSISKAITRGAMTAVNGIIVHQTGYLAPNVFNSYTNPASNGAHFLIDTDGTIYQTVSVFNKAYHVGRLKARCLFEKKCTPTEIGKLQKWADDRNTKETHKWESAKPFPKRFPSNEDSIGIECVGLAFWYGKDGKKLADQTDAAKALRRDKEPIYDPLTPAQKLSLDWLILELVDTLKVSMTEVYRHPVVSIKTTSEAESAQSTIDALLKGTKKP